MTPQELAGDIIAYCKENADEAIVRKYSRYFKGGYKAYGLTQEKLHAKMDHILRSPDISMDLITRASYLLVKIPEYEMTAFALLLLRNFSKEFTRATFTVIETWFQTGIHNWAHTDGICSELISIFYKKSLITYQDLDSWKRADNKFQRRAVPVSMIKLLKTIPDPKPLFAFLEPMMMDPEREVHQGLGWFLREAWKKHPGITEDFLLKWKETAPRLIFQYATEKMTAEARQKFRRAKR